MRLLIQVLASPIQYVKCTSLKFRSGLILALLAIAPLGWAQTQEGNHLVGMTVSELRFSFLDRLSSSIQLSPAYAQFIRPNLAVGLEVPFYYAYSTYQQAPKRATQMALTPFIRYYRGEGWVKPFISLLAGPRYSATSLYHPTQAITQYESATDLVYGLRTGAAFFFNSSVSLDLSLSYVTKTPNRRKSDLYFGVNTLGYDQSQGLQLNVGFQVYLDNSKRY